MMDIPTGIPPRLPELLAPAGSFDALTAAVDAGADAVYLGGTAFNARMNAANFDDAALSEGIAYAHERGSRVYLTLNTLIYDRELTDVLRAAARAAEDGVDALIVADTGAAELIHHAMPTLQLHASTQFSGHSGNMGRVLSARGFSRFVIARETSLDNLKQAVKESPIEIETFIHGALCVCHSGQCLFSSMVGGRSGNRGECAQPCRLPYVNTRTGREQYPLSLKDLCLARYVPELIDSGVASLKIEGRMKSPAYVGGVTGIYRRLLDENRAATPDEVSLLSALFSRDGFTDGYFTGNVNHEMLGVRRDEDKKLTKQVAPTRNETGHRGQLPVRFELCASDDGVMTLSATAPLYRNHCPVSVTAVSEDRAPDTASETGEGQTDRLTAQLAKTGGTPYYASDISTRGALRLLPVSQINRMRREALEGLTRARLDEMATNRPTRLPDDATAQAVIIQSAQPLALSGADRPCVDARFYRPEQVTGKALEVFDTVWLPLQNYRDGIERTAALTNGITEKLGVILPPVIFDRDEDRVTEMLSGALSAGISRITVENPGHIPLIERAKKKAGLSESEKPTLVGGFRLGVCNRISAFRYLSDGMERVILSPELTLARLRDLCGRYRGRASVIVYGRVPLMLLEKCVIRELYGHKTDKPGVGPACAVCATGGAVLVDRMGKSFPVLREYGHRNVIYNSVPVSMTDRRVILEQNGIESCHFIFSTESRDEIDGVISAWQNGTAAGGEVRRIK